MNRKLLNGLLVAAIAAGGVGTFTSCKDDNFRNDVLLEQDSLAAKLEAIRGVSDGKFKENLEAWLNGWTKELAENGEYPFKSYEEMVNLTSAMYDLYSKITKDSFTEIPEEIQPFCNYLYTWITEGAIKAANAYTDSATNAALESANAYTDEKAKALQEQIDKLNEWIESLNFASSVKPSSIEVNRVYNPVFGSINLPVGINSTVLATYEYKATGAPYNFPADAYKHLAEASPLNSDDSIFEEVAGIIKKLCPGSESNLLPETVDFTAADGTFGNMGGAVVTLNPTNIDINAKDKDGNRLYKVELVKSNGESVFSTADGDDCLALDKFEGELMFGASRAENSSDLYALQVNATEENLDDLYFDLDKSELKDAFKQLVDEKNVSSIAHLGEVVFRAVNNKLPAYAVKVSWDDPSFSVTEGNVTQTTTPNSIYSEFNLAATVVHPLSYGTMISAVIPENKRLPFISPLEDYITKLQKKLDFEYTEIGGIDYIDFNLSIDVEGNYLIVEFTNEYGEKETMELLYNLGQIEWSEGQVREFVNAILQAINLELGGEINNQLVADINKSISDINDQLKKYDGQVGDLQSYLEEIKDSKKLIYANKLVDIYNKLATYANKFLDNPNHYLQVMMAYSAGNGPHHMSPMWRYPTMVDASMGDGFKVYISSHTGDVVVPSYKKYVAITGEVNPATGEVNTANVEQLNKDAGLNNILPGNQEVLAVNLSNLKGKVVRLTYVSVDYRGMSSMENYYLGVR